MDSIILIISAIIGFLFAKVTSGKKEGKKGLIKFLIFSYKNYFIHIHHWLWATILLIIFLILGYYNPIIYGFLIGLIVHGLTYKDFYRIFYKL